MMITGKWARDDALPCTECTCACPSCTDAVGRARLLYLILHTSGIDASKEIKVMW
jgi:hypothetical protein